jgi:hypothetical protein
MLPIAARVGRRISGQPVSPCYCPPPDLDDVGDGRASLPLSGLAAAAGRGQFCRPESSAEANRLFQPATRSRANFRHHAHVRNRRGGEATASASLRPEFKLAAQYLNPYTFAFVAAEAGINQARNHPKDYGQGAEGYGKRYGAGLADGLSDGIFVTGVYPSLFHQDPRYYRLGDGSFSQRAEYAVTRILVTQQDSGRKAFNVSEILGSFSSAALAVTYYPRNERDFSDVAQRAGIQFAFDAGFDLVKEFYPEIERKFFRKKRQQ